MTCNDSMMVMDTDDDDDGDDDDDYDGLMTKMVIIYSRMRITDPLGRRVGTKATYMHVAKGSLAIVHPVCIYIYSYIIS
jgi:hypothetical protein